MKPYAFLLSACLFAAGPALAQTEEVAPDDVIVTAQRGNETQVEFGGDVGVLGRKAGEDVPFSVRGYNAALILNQQALTLGQVLENDPTVRTTYGFGNAAEQFVIRGFVLFGDDLGLNGLYGVAPRQLVAPELYEQVQVLNGASAFLNGAAPGGSGLGGSVNLISKRAGDRPLTRVSASYLADGHVGGSFDVARRFGGGRFGVRINGAARRGEVAIDDEDRRAYVIGAGLDYAGDRLRLALDLAFQRVEVRRLRPKVTIASAAIPEPPRADANYGQSYAYTKLRDVFGTARAEYDLGDKAMLYAAFGARDGSEEGIYDGLTVTDAVTGAATGNALFVPRTDNNEAAQAGLRVKLSSGGVTHEVNVGATYLWQVNRNAFDFRFGPGFAGFATNLYAPRQVALLESSFVGGDLDDPYPISRSRLGSVFASDTVGLFGDRVLVTAGLRLQRIQVRGYSYADGSENARYDEDAVTPVFGVVVKPVRGVSLYANRIEGLAQGPTAPVDATLSNPGEIFAPFKSTQVEVGGKLALGPVNVALAVFRIERPSAFALPDPGAPGLNRFGVDGLQRNQGVELTLEGEVARGLRVIAGGSVIDAELRRTAGGANEGNRVAGVPDYLANANVEWDPPFAPALTLTGRVVRTGEQEVDVANTLSIPAWTRFDLGARYVALVGDRPLTLRAGVDNVANERFWTSAFDVFSPQLLQGAPRTFRLSASVDL